MYNDVMAGGGDDNKGEEQKDGHNTRPRCGSSLMTFLLYMHLYRYLNTFFK